MLTSNKEMRPSSNQYEKDIYECLDCGKRTQDPETRMCGDCGGEFVNLSKSRDL